MSTADTTTSPTKHPILLVDDEPEILFSLKGLLRREFELYTAESGQEALKILHEHPIHVIMTDQRMPEMTGTELMGRVKNEFPDAMRIVFTGYADIRAVVDAINNGGLFRYITKPWDPDDLIQVLREATAAYESLVERKRLLADVEQFVQRVGNTIRENVDSNSSPWKELSDEANQLLPRISKVRSESKQ